ncbi:MULTISPECIES: hypothetical protein [Brevibacillus]|jgi:hypothetical protein|uniref:Uncharacterized protein n=1 Tax=Brevibacillus centrosporus TaxID=54910 RepID=A0A1I3SQM5_9BACL|nr:MULTISPECIES: hypothetical protein [Brevibacillus]MDR7318857.1 hypothetical protein [Brevibacillus nitrificans]MEC2132353.1 hypothetical protein [Brevibacillus centrosporus]MED1792698.1 hypothetical protein [Brevibacillus nitrificans]MED1951669.1 hypothetical protein [Brevibacillus centrosporus]MED4909504.1 hypothetical protein [Brevibacillus centrosporus]
MTIYRFMFETATRKWVEIIKAPSMFEAAKQAKQLASARAKSMSTSISFSFHHAASIK